MVGVVGGAEVVVACVVGGAVVGAGVVGGAVVGAAVVAGAVVVVDASVAAGELVAGATVVAGWAVVVGFVGFGLGACVVEGASVGATTESAGSISGSEVGMPSIAVISGKTGSAGAGWAAPTNASVSGADVGVVASSTGGATVSAASACERTLTPMTAVTARYVTPLAAPTAWRVRLAGCARRESGMPWLSTTAA